MIRNRPKNERGSALLVVLWMTAALAAIAFTVASTVRAETERAATEADSLRAYYIATGSIERMVMWMQWGFAGITGPNGQPMFYTAPMPRHHFDYPEGAADVEIIPETSKLNINQIPQDQLTNLLVALGVPGEQAMGIAAGIVYWRSPAPGGGYAPMDAAILGGGSSFRARHASIEENEELLLVPGMTPDIFYGGYRPTQDGGLQPYGGLRDCVSPYGVMSNIDINTVQPAVLAMLGLNPGAIQALVARRNAMPFTQVGDAAVFAQGAPGFGRLGLGGMTMWTIRATAQFRLPDGRLSDLRRTVSALVKMMPQGYDPPYEFMRWYDGTPPLRSLAPAPAPVQGERSQETAQ